MLTIAFYKGPGNLADWLIRKWTGSIYSHCEIVVNGMCYSSSAMDNGVRCKPICLDPTRWDTISLPSWLTEDQVLNHFEKTKGLPYGYTELVTSQIFNLASGSNKSDFCSEWCAAACGLPTPEVFNPHTLKKMIEFLNQLDRPILS